MPATAGSPDAPFFGALGSGAFGDITGDGRPEYVAPTGGLRKLLDVVAPAQQGQLPDADSFVEDGVFAHHQLTAWNPTTGAVLPAFPRVMDDMQFIGSPSLADVTGDGIAEVVNGSGAYLVRAYAANGATPAGWPKFTHGWHISSPTPGDVDGDGLIEIVAITREGNLFVWDTPAAASETALPWAGFGRDRRNTKNGASGVSNVAQAVDPLAALGWELEGIQEAVTELIPTLPAQDAFYLEGCCRDLLIDQALAQIAASNDFRTAQRIPGIEWSLRMPAHPIPALVPIYQRFSNAVRATAVREIAAAGCQASDFACNQKVAIASNFLARGDAAAGPQAKVFYWSRAISVW